MDAGIGKLSDLKIRRFIKTAKPGQKLADGGGLYLYLTPSRTATFRIDYRILDAAKGKVVQRTYSIGVYPEITLANARDERGTVRALITQGRDPLIARTLDRAKMAVASGTTFGDVARQWLTERKAEWSEIHFDKSERALQRDVLPWLNDLPVADIETALIADVVQRVSKRGSTETAGRILQHLRGVLSYAKARGQTTYAENPADAAASILPKRKPVTRRAAIHDIAELGAVLRYVERSNASAAVKMAHRLVAFAPGCRLWNVVSARWSEFDLDGETPTWTIPRQSMKVKGRAFDHTVILGPSLVESLRQWRRMSGARASGYLFPSPTGSDKHITREGLEKLYRVTLKDEIAGRQQIHGWRSSFSTLARERGFSKEAVELALDHIADDDVVRAYDRGARLDERTRLAYWWDGELSRAEREPTDAIVLPINRHERAG